METPLLQISFNEVALVLSIVLTTLAQVLLRFGARNKSGAMTSVFNLHALSAYALLLIVVLLMMYAMQQVPLKTAITWVSTCYILIPLAAHWLLKEPLTSRMLAGGGLIVLGIVIFSL